ncbi:jacalin-related lectin 25-like [Solanum dulcamara]|uniref:jacalin-related lectin 25-like n=1 Tax=Solanum dulcamara TaxID=45834 RepID=UPI002485A91A|nr:jacalin-related lectin 25-like [Solanum dulcamara]
MDSIKVGPVGGCGGSIWEEKGDELAGIFVSYDEETVNSLQFLNYVNGKLDMSAKYGNHQFLGGFHGTKYSYGIESIGFYVKDIPSYVIKLNDSPVQVKKGK